VKGSARALGDNALVVLTALVQSHRAGGEIHARLQSDWSDLAGVPTITVRIGNHVTVRQAGTYHEAAEALLVWAGRVAG
jgi:hypothetical protein